VTICKVTKRWYRPELHEMRKTAQRARSSYSKSRHQGDKQKWLELRRAYFRKIDECKRETWEKFVSEIDGQDMWKLNNYLNNTYIPTLEGTAATNNQKTEVLSKTFFPPPPPADLNDIPGASYPAPVPTNLNITLAQVTRAPKLRQVFSQLKSTVRESASDLDRKS
jgi:hypothetical protein